MAEDEIKQIVQEAIAATSASGMRDMGKVMGIVSAKISGKADNQLVASIVKSLLSQ